MWEKPSYEIIDVCAEVTAYVYKESGEGQAESPVVEKEAGAGKTEAVATDQEVRLWQAQS